MAVPARPPHSAINRPQRRSKQRRKSGLPYQQKRQAAADRKLQFMDRLQSMGLRWRQIPGSLRHLRPHITDDDLIAIAQRWAGGEPLRWALASHWPADQKKRVQKLLSAFDAQERNHQIRSC